ncbi:hypothetical protein [Sporosarcina sp. FA9]|uniref:hypothetical protein n=1 Tax=Sporosarcina sp. FA9 TaxID=3413030 RepID=UPI003F65B1BB
MAWLDNPQRSLDYVTAWLDNRSLVGRSAAFVGLCDGLVGRFTTDFAQKEKHPRKDI